MNVVEVSGLYWIKLLCFHPYCRMVRLLFMQLSWGEILRLYHFCWEQMQIHLYRIMWVPLTYSKSLWETRQTYYQGNLQNVWRCKKKKDAQKKYWQINGKIAFLFHSDFLYLLWSAILPLLIMFIAFLNRIMISLLIWLRMTESFGFYDPASPMEVDDHFTLVLTFDHGCPKN